MWLPYASQLINNRQITEPSLGSTQVFACSENETLKGRSESRKWTKGAMKLQIVV
ncbi:hypothetical protein SMSP2_01552 [Limihaloglobus sulfuriphilus]|uniref:Uncharacterized protein n=1 Tax=Limihaloglobus sulfuriphilus TaxID=1851148 RepID=A0A1Q2MEQ4_9BACT|nr:hypothetical protein SMSP2_01552 [Limihaloglobus sulfuriphilus]